MTIEKNTLAFRLRQARKNAGMTQQELADRAGMTRDAIAKIETGQSQQTRKIMAIAKALDVSAAWLQFGVEEIDTLSKDSIEFALAYQKLPKDQQETIDKLMKKMSDINKIRDSLD